MATRLRRPSPLAKRLRPLHLAAFLQGVGFWVPVEKLFMNEIGFDAATIGLMAAAYAAFVPMLEIPSGILADRWSRRGVLIVSSLALLFSALVGGLSNDVPTYIVSALILGVFFAANSGTLDSVVYDTVLEETGDGEQFERQIGRVRLYNSAAMVASTLAGGVLASMTSTRTTFMATIPFAALSIVALLKFTEPRLHRTEEATSLRDHIAMTYRTLTRRGRLLPIITQSVLTALILQVLLEFGPLWLVGAATPAVLYGPYWAGLVSSLGLGGILAGRFSLDNPKNAVVAAVLMTLSGLALTASTSFPVVTGAQIVLALLVVAASIHVSRLLHDAVPSTIRSGVASGVGTFSWIAFLPFSVVLGLVSDNYGVQRSGWMVTAVAAGAGALLAGTALARQATPAGRAPAAQEPASA